MATDKRHEGQMKDASGEFSSPLVSDSVSAEKDDLPSSTPDIMEEVVTGAANKSVDNGDSNSTDEAMSSDSNTTMNLLDNNIGGGAVMVAESLKDGRKDTSTERETASIVDSAASCKASVSEKNSEMNQTYVCSCGEAFSKSAELAAHKRWSCKLAEKKCQCEVCGRWFAHELGLRRHIKLVHGGVFPCDRCDLRFHSKLKLTRHWMESHFDEEHDGSKLKCYVCDKDDFVSKYEMECHILAHKYAKIKNRELTGSVGGASNQESIQFQEDSSSSASRNLPRSSQAAITFGHQRRMHPPFGHFPGHFQKYGSPSDGMARSSCSPPLPSPPQLPPPPSSYSHDHSPPPTSAPSRDRPPPPIPPRPHHSHFGPPLSPPHGSHPPIPPRPHHDHHPPFLPPFPQYDHHDFDHDHHDHCHDHHHDHHDILREHGHHHHPHSTPPPHPGHHGPPHIPFHDGHIMKKFHKHHNKWKWKHYFKNLMSQHLPSHYFPRGGPGSGRGDCHSDLSELNNSSSFPASEKSGHAMITCKFCGESVHPKYFVYHNRRGCPVLCVHKCQICWKAFASEQLLRRHMRRQRHFNHSANLTIQGDEDSTSISGLPEKLTAVLNFQKVDESRTASPLSQDKPIESAQRKPPPLPQISVTDASVSEDSMSDDSLPQSQVVIGSVDEIQHEKNRIGSRESSKNLTCAVCHCKMETQREIQLHLQDHLAHVESIQKVQEWKQKSAKFFLDKNVSEVDSISVPSCGASADLSTNTSVSYGFDDSSNITSDLSLLSTVASEYDKWVLPHGKHRQTKPKRQVFPCKVCDEKFAFRKDLHHHVKEKHQDYSLECPICHKKYSTKNRSKFYERHMKSHFGGSVYKYKCEVCDKSFLENHKLQAHMAKHKSELLHTCSICGKGYGNKSSLIRHQRKHTGNKPHQCEVCSESFWEKRELIRHSSCHTGTAPFVCSHCDQGFTLKTSLVKHVKRKHPGLDINL